MLKKSVIIAGRHNTSISIEREFYDELLAVCRERNISLNALVTEIDSARSGETNLSAAVRIYILQYLKNKIPG